MDAPTPLLSAKRDFNRLGLSLLAMALIPLLVQLVLAFVIALLTPSGVLTERTSIGTLLGLLPLYAVAYPAGLLILRTVPAAPYTPAKLRAKDYWTLFLICLPLLFGGSLIGNALSALLSGGRSTNPVDSLLSELGWIEVLTTVVLAPLFEEFIFRKQLIDRSARYGEGAAIVFSALMFGLFHMNLYQFFYAFLLGLVFGYVYLRTRRLRYTVFMHMSINAIGGVLPMLLLRYVGDDVLEMEDFSAALSAPDGAVTKYLLMSAYSLLIFALCITGFVLLIAKCRRLVLLPAPDELPRGTRLRTICCAGVISFTLVCVLVGILYLFLL